MGLTPPPDREKSPSFSVFFKASLRPFTEHKINKPQIQIKFFHVKNHPVVLIFLPLFPSLPIRYQR